MNGNQMCACIDQKSLDIKTATKNDIPLVLEFIRELAEYERMAEQVVASEESVEQSLFCESPAAEAFIGRVNNEPVAFAIIFHNYSTFVSKPGLYLEDLFVKPEQRGKGFGKTMLQFLAKLAIKRGCGRFEWAVLDWNKPAIDFYKSLGAEAMDEWTVFRLADEALENMAKDS